MFEIRKTRTVAQGRRKPTREREEYFRLVQQGVSYAEAAKAVGINLRTGKRWRNGRNPSGRQKAAPPGAFAVPLGWWRGGVQRVACSMWILVRAKRIRRSSVITGMAHSG
ncbi:helix-turn-helix domain-containing protein [Streptomyces sp. NPDC048297]|uniref:helix-turn-helix domain-containing protein n=1 Tax=Streptomyces sp. NPDC048297 TaxID=3365531 RepID=UPI003720C25A